MRKRPRTHAVLLDLPCTSALSSVSPPIVEKIVSPTNELFATRNPIDDALAELDVFLGIGSGGYVSSQPFSLSKPCFSIEEELDAAIEAVKKPRERTVPISDLPDNSSCVSSSANPSSSMKFEACSTPIDVLHELEALESRTSTTIMSPPLVKSYYKRRRRS